MFFPLYRSLISVMVTMQILVSPEPVKQEDAFFFQSSHCHTEEQNNSIFNTTPHFVSPAKILSEIII